MKRARTDCACIVGVGQAIKRDGRSYCSDACAGHHQDEAGCHHAGCTGHG